MAHIAVIMTGLTGNLNSSFGIVSKLVSEGHKITYLSVLDVREKVEQYGIAYVQLPGINFSPFYKNFEEKKYSWIKKFLFHKKNKSIIHKESRKNLGLYIYEKIITDLKIDKVIIDQELHDLIFVCFNLNISITLFNSWFSNEMGYGIKLPPLRTNIIPGKGFRGSIFGIFISWMFIKLKVQARIYINRLTFKGYRRAVLKKYAKESGFPFKTVISSNLPQLFSYTNLPLVSSTMAEMDFPHTPAKNFIYAGPMVYEKRDVNIKLTADKVINEIIKIKQQTRKKLIYCSASSLLIPEVSFINRVIQAVEEQDEWLLIISLGGKLSVNTFETKPKNIYILPWVPQMKVLEYADCCITPAGINSINECIHFAVPMLAYSGKKFDQNGCAARVHYHGLGIMGDKDKDSYLEIRHNIQRIFVEPSFISKSNFFNKKYLEYKKKELTPLLN